ncbi:hypothetical protein FGO68_gene3077 [Halteria grandinella]|uniref:Secreted protein n=1 Tax=Halteria grandinella TaxID=5974 RepID=A0A8J8NQ59_HALGN|nr:hypothetical protein FGO68_gene3077 [Halteria grandinella]
MPRVLASVINCKLLSWLIPCSLQQSFTNFCSKIASEFPCSIKERQLLSTLEGVPVNCEFLSLQICYARSST